MQYFGFFSIYRVKRDYEPLKERHDEEIFLHDAIGRLPDWMLER